MRNRPGTATTSYRTLLPRGHPSMFRTVMSLPSLTCLMAATATGTPVLSVVDFSGGGLLVQAAEPFPLGSVVHLRLWAADAGRFGTFAFRCLHAHRTDGPGQTRAHISALVFVHPLDERTRRILAGLGHPGRRPLPRGRRVLRFTGGANR